jgi:hypothetical protein
MENEIKKKNRSSIIFQMGLFSTFVLVLNIVISSFSSGSSIFSFLGWLGLFAGHLAFLTILVSIVGVIFYILNPVKKGNALIGLILMSIYLLIYLIGFIL